GLSSVSAEYEDAVGGIAEFDGDLDDLELTAPPPQAMAVSRGNSPRRDSVDDFDPAELLGRNHIAHGSPAPARPPLRPARDSIEFEFDAPSSQSTRQVPPDQVQALADMPIEDEDDAVLVDRPPPQWGEQATGFDGAQ